MDTDHIYDIYYGFKIWWLTGLLIVIGIIILVRWGKIVFFIFVGIPFIAGYYYLFNLEDKIVEYLSVDSKMGVVLSNLGLSVNDEEDCKLATCSVYSKIHSLIEDGYLQTKNPNNNLTIESIITFTDSGKEKYLK